MSWIQKANRSLLLLAVLAFITLAPPLAAERGSAPAPRLDGAGFEGLVDPAKAFFESAELHNLLTGSRKSLDDVLNTVYTLEHHVPIGDGRTLYVTEHFTLRSWFRFPHRAALMLTGPEFQGSTFWSIPFEGYNGTEMMARRGFFAFTPDYVGTGNSYKPADGSDIDFRTQVEPMQTLLRYIRFFRWVPRIDLLGEGYGGEVATQLAADRHRVKSCVLSVMVYKDLLPQELVSPEWAAFLASFPDGYFVPPFYDITFGLAAPEIQDWLFATQPDLYPTGPFWILFEGLPYFDPGVARVPGLVIAAANEIVAGPTDAADLAADYGTGGADLVVLSQGFHAVRIEPRPAAGEYWDAVFDFIDP